MGYGVSDLIVPKKRQSSPQPHVHIRFDISVELIVNGSDVGERGLLYYTEFCCNPWNPSSHCGVLDSICHCLFLAGYDDHEIEHVLNKTSQYVNDTVNAYKSDNSKNDVVWISLSTWKTELWEDIVDEYLEQAMEESAPKPIPATKESIDALKKVKLGVGDIINNEVSVGSQTCAVCLEELNLIIAQAQPLETKELIIASMPCSHLFHEDCIVQWLNTSHLCPLCRFPMPTYADN